MAKSETLTRAAEDRLRDDFWKALAASPFGLLQLASDVHSSAPMSAQLDKDANGEIWFWTKRDNRFADGGEALYHFAAKDHKFFARLSGTLSEDIDPARREKMWDNTVEAWFPEGKHSPDVVLLKYTLGPAALWDGDMNLFEVAKMFLSQDVRHTVAGKFVETDL